jgi:hypothetical protein
MRADKTCETLRAHLLSRIEILEAARQCAHMSSRIKSLEAALKDMCLVHFPYARQDVLSRLVGTVYRGTERISTAVI